MSTKRRKQGRRKRKQPARSSSATTRSRKEQSDRKEKRKGKEKRYPMPCPGCRKMIDARDHLCPYCGIDTDAKLAPFRFVFSMVAVALALGLLWGVRAMWTSCRSSQGSAGSVPGSAPPRSEPTPVKPPPAVTEQAEIEPNDSTERAQKVSSATRIRGAVGGKDRDYFQIAVEPPGAKRLFVALDGAAGTRIRVVGDGGRVRAEAVAPEQVVALGVRPMAYFVVVEAAASDAGAADYRLSIDVKPAGPGDEWEPNDEPARASPLATLRRVVAGDPDRVFGRTQGRGWWSSAADRDCFELPTGFRKATELRIEIQPPAGVTPRLWVMDAVDPRSRERRLLAASTAREPKGAHQISVGAWQWKKALVACASPAGGKAIASPYRIEVHAIDPAPDRPVDLEPNDDRQKAQFVPPDAHIRGHLPPGDIDRFVLEPTPAGKLEVTLAPTPVAAALTLLDREGTELARAQTSPAAETKAAAKRVAYVVLQSSAAPTAEPKETAYRLELSTSIAP